MLNNCTLDEAEVSRHAKQSTDWWERNGSMQGLHSINQLRIPWAVEVLSDPAKRNTSNPLAGLKILDIGCGGGLATEELAKLGAEVTGVDPCKELIECAKSHCTIDEKVAANKPVYYCTTIEEHVYDFPEHYDAVLASEVLDHVSDVKLFLQHCVGAMKPGAKIFITCPNRTRLAQFLVIFVAENIINQVPKGLHTYSKFVKPAEVRDLLAIYNCNVDNVRGIFYYPFFDKWKWVFFQSMWYGLLATKLSNKSNDTT